MAVLRAESGRVSLTPHSPRKIVGDASVMVCGTSRCSLHRRLCCGHSMQPGASNLVEWKPQLAPAVPICPNCVIS